MVLCLVAKGYENLLDMGVHVNYQLKSGLQMVGRELTRIEEQVQLLDLESQKL